MMRPDDSPAPTTSMSSSHRQLLLSDRERDQLALQEQKDSAAQLLDVIGTVLQGADATLDNLEVDSELLPNAILRRCTEFADVVGNLAGQLERQSPEERERLAGAIHDDVRRQQQELRRMASDPIQQDLLLDERSEDNDPSAETMSNRLVVHNDDPSDDQQQQMALADQGLDHKSILEALAGASTLLRDVEATFRDVGKDEAEEIADVALTFARLFLISLQSIYATLTPDDVLPDNYSTTLSSSRNRNGSPRSTVFIEEVPDDEDEIESEQPPASERETGSRRLSILVRQRRLRVLWPRLGPQVETAMAWTKEEATKRPLLAVALGLTLWPVAITTALIGGGVVLADGIVQDAYNHFQNTPLIDTLEQGAAQAYHAGRLTLVTGKLVAKQTLRVASRQIERQGGLGPVLENIGGMALHRAAHPIETVGMVWDGLNWSVGLVKENVDKILALRQECQVAQVLQS